MEPHEERIAELRGQIDEIDRQLIELLRGAWTYPAR